MKVAALDLGTNTFLCLIAEGDAAGIQRVHRDLAQVVRLGQEVDRTGRFHPDALIRAKDCLTQFRKEIDAVGGVDVTLAVATSAARDVQNGQELFSLARDLGIPIRVIAGAEEARLSYMGAVTGEDPDKKVLVIDVGGGSTEFILGQGGNIFFSRSVDVGGVRLTERHISQQPVSAAEESLLVQKIRETLTPTVAEIQALGVDHAVAVAGTPAALAALELGGFVAETADGFFISSAILEKWNRIFAQTSVEEKKTKYQLGGRADIIFAGTTILKCAVEALQLRGLKVSVKGLRYGLASQLLSQSPR